MIKDIILGNKITINAIVPKKKKKRILHFTFTLVEQLDLVGWLHFTLTGSSDKTKMKSKALFLRLQKYFVCQTTY